MDSPSRFPTVRWGRQEVTFLAGERPEDGSLPVAALVFAMQAGRFLVADIVGRGWCVPGGRLEAGETPEQAVHREAWEETGAALERLRYLGHCRLVEPESGRRTAVFLYLAQVGRLEPPPPDTESRGVRLLTFEELPSHYYTWDALMAAMFAYAREQAEQESPPQNSK